MPKSRSPRLFLCRRRIKEIYKVETLFNNASKSDENNDDGDGEGEDKEDEGKP